MAGNTGLKMTIPIAALVSCLLGFVGSYWAFATESKADRAELRTRMVNAEQRLDRLEKCSQDVSETLKRIEVSLATIATKLDLHTAGSARLPGTPSALPRTPDDRSKAGGGGLSTGNGG